MGQSNSKLRVTSTDKAILQLKLAKDNLHRYSKRTDSLLATEKEELKKIIAEEKQEAKKNPRARLLLKRIHYQQHLLGQCSDQLINLENLLMTIEFKLVEKQFIERLKQGNEVLQKLNREFEGVHTILDDAEEQIAYQEEIDNALSNSMVSRVGGYQEVISRELEALANEAYAEAPRIEMPSVDGLPKLGEHASQEEARDKGKKQNSGQPAAEMPMLA